ncbi:MAG: tetratricopeptide repeat protein [archaeon]|nr:tetratricopeptide repeat protein [archaeon]
MSEMINNSNQNQIPLRNQMTSPTLNAVTNTMKDLMFKYASMNLFTPALFYAEKNLNLKINNQNNMIPEYIYDVCNYLYMRKEYSRCASLIQKYNLTYYSQKFLILYGQSLFSCEDYERVINFLDKENIIYEVPTQNEKDLKFLESVKCLLLGKSYEMQENKQPAVKNYIKSLQYDSTNIESFNILISHLLISTEEKKNLLNSLVFEENMKWLEDYYRSKIEDNIYMTNASDVELEGDVNMESTDPNIDQRENIMDILYKNNDNDLMKMDAEKYFNLRNYSSAYEILKKINDEDLFNLDIVPMLCSSMIELGKIGELYTLAFKLANGCSEKNISWYAVGCYYFSMKKYDSARKYFQKSIQLDKSFPENLIALGNCFACEEESDQAISAYRTCLRLFPGCHFANLYIGMEFIKGNNFKTALTCFDNALAICKNDPLIYNEIGIANYKQKKYEEAEQYFIKGLELCREESSNVYQSLTLNLANCYRKETKYDLAIENLMKLYHIDSRNVEVLKCIGLTYSLLGFYDKALEFLHKANFIKSNDTFISELITRCINDLEEEEQIQAQAQMQGQIQGQGQ